MRYTGPKEKLSRKIGENLGLKAERSFSPKSAFLKKPYKPGAHGKARRRALSEFGTQLLEKQKIKITYSLTEKKLKKYYNEVIRKKGITGDLLLSVIEARLDNAVFRSGFAPSRTMARQLVSHGHLLVNNKKVNIPSYPTRAGDVITINSRSRNKAVFFDLANKLKKREIPSWLAVDKTIFEIKVKSVPKIEDLPKNLNINAVVSYYSR
ncbi:MAG: 30S ribosomal protein S4 [Patescibacteria group bacterium]